MPVPPMNGCFCDDCMIDYFKQSWIHEKTAAWDDVMRILKKRNLTYTQMPGYTPTIREVELG